jgi:hypothetical protein
MASHLLLLLAVLAATPVAAQPPALTDQYGTNIGLEDYAGEAVLAIVVSARKLRQIERWEQKLRAELPQLRSLRVADINEQPLPSQTQVATKLRQRVPEGVSVQIDLQSLWAAHYALDTKEPCLLLFDNAHNVVAQYRGRAKNALVSEVLVALQPYFKEQ